MKENSIQTIVVAIDPVNAEYIMQNDEIVRTFHRAADYIRDTQALEVLTFLNLSARPSFPPRQIWSSSAAVRYELPASHPAVYHINGEFKMVLRHALFLKPPSDGLHIMV